MLGAQFTLLLYWSDLQVLAHYSSEYLRVPYTGIPSLCPATPVLYIPSPILPFPSLLIIFIIAVSQMYLEMRPLLSLVSTFMLLQSSGCCRTLHHYMHLGCLFYIHSYWHCQILSYTYVMCKHIDQYSTILSTIATVSWTSTTSKLKPADMPANQDGALVELLRLVGT